MRFSLGIFPLFAVIVLSGVSLGQSNSASSFEKAVRVDESFRTLNDQFNLLLERRGRLVKEWGELQQRLMDNQTDMQNVVSKNNAAYADAQTLTDHALAVTQVAQRETRLSSPQSLFNFSGQYKQDMIDLAVVNTRLKNLDAATKYILERQYKILSQIQQASQNAQQWMVDEQKLLDQYIEQSDLEGVQSDLELKAAARALRAARDNHHARLALAITLMRLEQTDTAKELIDPLLQLPELKPLAMAVIGEILARDGEAQASKKQFAQSLHIAPNDPRVRMLRARSFNIIGEHKSALADWELLLRSGKYEIAAHRGLALTYSNFPNNQRSCQEALKHAKLASSLAGEIDWSCQIALALATAHNGDLNEAASLAEKAADLAVTEKRVLCMEIAEELKAGRIPSWVF